MKSQIVQAREAWWQEHVGRWRRSGMSKSGYCATHGLSLNSFRYWLHKSRSSMDTPPRRATSGRGRSVHFGPKGSVLWSRGRESLCFGYSG